MTDNSKPKRRRSHRRNLLDWLAGVRQARYPESVAPPVLHFMLNWRLYLEKDERRRYIDPLAGPALITNRADNHDKLKQAASNWLVHINAPTWLDLAGLPEQAAALRDLPDTAPSQYGDDPDPALLNTLHDVANATHQAMASRGLRTLTVHASLAVASTAASAAATAGAHPIVSTLASICAQAATVAAHNGTDLSPNNPGAERKRLRPPGTHVQRGDFRGP